MFSGSGSWEPKINGGGSTASSSDGVVSVHDEGGDVTISRQNKAKGEIDLEEGVSMMVSVKTNAHRR